MVFVSHFIEYSSRGDLLASQADQRPVAMAGFDVLLPEEVPVALESEEVLLLELSKRDAFFRIFILRRFILGTLF